jgi:hypoxanthine-DNA glycosylase
VHIQGFAPICNHHARALILGSMPSRESLRQQRYYAHDRNSFWPILSKLLDMGDLDYHHRVEQVVSHGIAVWDVLKACFRSDSLDSSIEEASIVTNDFRSFYQACPGITRVFFNGAKAESIYRKHVLPELAPASINHSLQRLPSTSPAHAAMSFENKLQAWKAIVT